ncbi:MAG: hypothetical protein LBB82_11110 [Treponema sp.]|nr:hypothetical protein [Treponema sp.]
MKRITLLLFLLSCTLLAPVFTAAETPGEETAEARPAVKKNAFLEGIKGLSLGIDAGTHEYPLEVWYTNRYLDGYSIRSFFLKPYILYNRTIDDFEIYAEADFAIDMAAADPSPAALALNGKDADRRTWFSIYLEEGLTYRLPIERIPGTLFTYINHRDNIYAAPQFPEETGALIEDRRLETYLGRFEWGAGYRQDFEKAGSFNWELGLPLSYLDRARGGIGFGVDVRMGYKDGYNLGLGGGIAIKLAFVPKARYAATEFYITYDWFNFQAELVITAFGGFERMAIRPLVVYRFKNINLKLGVDLTGLGAYPAFSPYLGFQWNF